MYNDVPLSREARDLSWPATKKRQLYFALKRIMDVSIASVLLLFLSPLFLLIAILIKVDSPGPVFFIQNRVGVKLVKKGKQTSWEKANFPCYKFRTMVHNANPFIHKAYVQALIQNDQEVMLQLQGAEQSVRKLVNDPRITRVGHILRKYSLDELPQFINILRNEMSLVGPRPAIPYEVEVYKPWQSKRLQTLPGITGLQQITNRCTADFDKQVALDIKYIENQSLWLDIWIIIQTPLVIVNHKGAC